MNWFTEDPTMLVVIAAFAIIGFAIAIVRTGRIGFLGPIVGVLVVLAVLLVVERLIVTESERVYDTIFEASDAVRKNDVEKTLAFVSTDSPEMRARIQSSFDRFKITQLKVTHAEPTINEFTSPLTAKVEFVARFSAQERNSSGSDYSVSQLPIRFIAELKLEEEGWRFTGYGHDQHQEPGNLPFPRNGEE